MKVTVFLGSPRAGGNTDTLAGKLMEGARESGVDIEAVELRKLKIHPCTGCDQCWKSDKPCVFEDDMTRLYQTIADSDIMVFVTPVYWYGPTTILKGFLDRLVPFNRPQGRALIEGKGAILVTAYEEQGPAAAEAMVRMFELSFAYLDLAFLERIIVDGAGPRGAVLQNIEALQRAYDVGRGLSGWLAI